MTPLQTDRSRSSAPTESTRPRDRHGRSSSHARKPPRAPALTSASAITRSTGTQWRRDVRSDIQPERRLPASEPAIVARREQRRPRSAPARRSRSELAGEIARSAFGVDGNADRRSTASATGTSGSTAMGGSFVLKVGNPADPAGVVEMQVLAMEHALRADAALPIAQPRRTRRRPADRGDRDRRSSITPSTRARSS